MSKERCWTGHWIRQQPAWLALDPTVNSTIPLSCSTVCLFPWDCGNKYSVKVR